jgi:hypothetical protein
MDKPEINERNNEINNEINNETTNETSSIDTNDKIELNNPE